MRCNHFITKRRKEWHVFHGYLLRNMMFARHDSECFYAVGRERFIVGDFRRTDAVDGMFLLDALTPVQRTVAKSPTFNPRGPSRYRHSCSVLHQPVARVFHSVRDASAVRHRCHRLCRRGEDDDIHHLLFVNSTYFDKGLAFHVVAFASRRRMSTSLFSFCRPSIAAFNPSSSLRLVLMVQHFDVFADSY